MNISHYKTLVFDCDGVLLDSNKVKTNAFFNAAIGFGERAARELVDYHVQRGGVSRYKKFEWFVEKFAPENKSESIKSLLDLYATEVRKGLLACDIVPGLGELRAKTKRTNWLVVSGGDQSEIREVFKERSIESLFDGGIFGSPDDKEQILEREILNSNIDAPALFLGDSRYDHIAASNTGLDFVFLNYWTEFKGWQNYCRENSISVVSSLTSLYV